MRNVSKLNIKDIMVTIAVTMHDFNISRKLLEINYGHLAEQVKRISYHAIANELGTAC